MIAARKDRLHDLGVYASAPTDRLGVIGFDGKSAYQVCLCTAMYIKEVAELG